MTLLPKRDELPSLERYQVNSLILIDNLNNFFDSEEIKTLLQNSKTVLLLKLEIQDVLSVPSLAALDELVLKCKNNAIVLLLAIKNVNNFFLIWKSISIQYFLMTKAYVDCISLENLQIFEFVANFLVKSLKQGHLGLHSGINLDSKSTILQLHELADYRNFNLLLIAAELGDLYIVDILLNVDFSSAYGNMNAQTLAYNNRHFNVLFTLLKSNLIFPTKIDVAVCPDEIKKFTDISLKLNEVILSENKDEVIKILSDHLEMKHFYNLKNQSAPAFALKNKRWDMYIILKSKGIKLGQHENFNKIKNKMKGSELTELRDIPYRETKFLPDNHLRVLKANTRIAPGTNEHDKKYKIIENAFEILNQNPLIQIILMIVAASRNFRIVFDFNHDSVEQIDPTTDSDLTRGIFYFFGRIYIGAKQLLDPNKKFEALGTLAHELCHCAMKLVYKNMANPYSVDDSVTKIDIEEISKTCMENMEHEEIIRLVYTCYSTNLHHAELIVRVPHLIMHYAI